MLPTSFVNSLDFFSQNGGHSHGGLFETSVVQAIKPEVVELSRAIDIDIKATSTDQPIHLLGKRRGEDWAGYHGKISEVSREKDIFLLKESVKRIINLIQEEWNN